MKWLSGQLWSAPAILLVTWTWVRGSRLKKGVQILWVLLLLKPFPSQPWSTFFPPHIVSLSIHLREKRIFHLRKGRPPQVLGGLGATLAYSMAPMSKFVICGTPLLIQLCGVPHWYPACDLLPFSELGQYRIEYVRLQERGKHLLLASPLLFKRSRRPSELKYNKIQGKLNQFPKFKSI